MLASGGLTRRSELLVKLSGEKTLRRRASRMWRKHVSAASEKTISNLDESTTSQVWDSRLWAATSALWWEAVVCSGEVKASGAELGGCVEGGAGAGGGGG